MWRSCQDSGDGDDHPDIEVAQVHEPILFSQHRSSKQISSPYILARLKIHYEHNAAASESNAASRRI